MSRVYLPKIPVVTTPVFHRSYTTCSSIYGSYPPKELSATSLDVSKIPAAVNPLRPPPPRKRINMHWETSDQHLQNEQRTTWLNQKEHSRFHTAWMKPFYGQPAEREAYRKHFRDVLKAQMDDRDVIRHRYLQERVQESDNARKFDRQCLQDDARKTSEKRFYLRKFMNENKSIMEEKWKKLQAEKFSQQRLEREILRYNPINWSGTLS